MEKTKIKIIDFGVAGLINSEKIKAGSIDYSPPEIVGGWDYETSNAIDIYSIGCLIFECLTGEKMFEGTSVQDKKVLNK